MFDGLEPNPLLVLLAPKDLGLALSRVVPFLETMARGSRGRFEAVDIVRAVAAGEMHLWTILDGALIAAVVVTQFEQYPRAKALRFVGLVGRNFKRWMHLREAIERWGANQGCTIFEAMALSKMRHILGPSYHAWHVLFEKGGAQ